MDEYTASQKLLTFARVYVKMDISKELPNLIWLEVEGAKPTPIFVECENPPLSS